MPDQVAEAVRKARSREMLVLGEASARLYREGFIGRTMTALFEQKSAGHWHGLTGNYIKVYLKSGASLENVIKPVKLAGLHRDGLLGEPV